MTLMIEIAWTAGQDARRFWSYFLLPAALIAGIRLIVTTVITSLDARR
ncbi:MULTISPECIES: hypothetical protein [Nonomuraea]|uniref:ABC transporter permease n=1 Tax=Nonomuraea salmonea TaxID=46181 RepID=A0ABV5NQM0_9ACTN